MEMIKAPSMVIPQILFSGHLKQIKSSLMTLQIAIGAKESWQRSFSSQE